MDNKLAYIVCTYIGNRRSNFGSPTTPDEVITSLDTVFTNWVTTDPGYPTDLIIIENESNEPQSDYLEEINGIEVEWGKVIVERRENKGASIGAYIYALEKYQDDYTHFILNEDDNYYNVENYSKYIIEEFKHNPKLGFLVFSEFKDELTGKLKYNIPQGSYKGRVTVGGGEGVISQTVVKQMIENNILKLALPTFENYANIGNYEMEFPTNIIKTGCEIRIPQLNNTSPIASNYELDLGQRGWYNGIDKSKVGTFHIKKLYER
jgi:hypothetical protein